MLPGPYLVDDGEVLSSAMRSDCEKMTVFMRVTSR